MQQHSSSSEESPPSHSPLESNPMVQARIDAYLNRTCAPLFLSLPQEEALQQRAEMQSHLESLITAHVELGYSEIEAVTLALEQFGKEQSVAHAWKQECEETKVEAGRGTFWSSIRPVAGYSTLNMIVFPMLVELANFINHSYSRTGQTVPEFLNIMEVLLLLGQYTLFPAFLGFQVGRRARGKVLLAALPALPFIMGMCGSLVMKIYQSFGLFLPPPGAYQPSFPLTYALLFYGTIFGFGALGAGIALWRRRRTLRLAGNR